MDRSFVSTAGKVTTGIDGIDALLNIRYALNDYICVGIPICRPFSQ